MTPWLVSVVLAPVLEEVVFRHGLQASLAQRLRGAAWANGLTALVFGLVHGLAHQRLDALLVAVPALAMGALYQRTGRVWPCIGLHAGMNVLWLLGGQAVWAALTQGVSPVLA